MFGAIAGGIASALAGGAMSKLFGGGQKAASGGIQGDVLATDNNTVGMGNAGIKSAIQGSNVPNPNEAVPSFVSGAMAKAGKGLLEGTLQAGTSAVSDKLLDLVGLGGKSAADKGKDTRDYLAAAFPELNAWERAGADASSAGMVDAGFENQKELTKMQLDNQKEIAEMQYETQKEIAGIQSATSRQNTKDQVYAQNEMLAYQQKESTARVASIMENTNLSKQQQVSEIMRQMLTQAQTAGQYFTNDQIKEMTRKVSAEVDLVHQQTQNQRYGSSHMGATAKDISNVVTDAASGVVDNTWPYGYSMPIAVRYTQDAFSRSGWLWPVDAKGEPLKATSYMAVGFYVAKYVNKKSDMDLAAKGLGAKEWNNSLKTKLSLLPKKLFRIRMSRNFGMKMLTMTNLSTECLIQLTKLGYDATPFNQILKQNAKREMRLRLGKVTVADVLAAQPVTTNLLKFMRASIKMIGVSNLQSFIASMTQKLTLSDISDESKNYLDKAGITTACLRIKSKWTAGGK